MKQGDLFGNEDEGERRKRDAMRRVESHADTDWKAAAQETIRRCAMRAYLITSDHVWANMPDGVETHEPRAMGPEMKRAQRLGWIEPYDFVLCKRPSRHRAPIQRWRSLLFKGGSSKTTKEER